MIAVLLRYRVRALANSIRFATVRQWWLSAGLGAAFLLVAAAIYVGAGGVVLLRGSGEAGTHLVHEMMLSVFLFMLAGSVPFLAATLLHPGDAELLGVAPIRARHAIVMRMVEGTAACALQFAPIGAPAVVASAVGLGAPSGLWALLLPFGLLSVLLPSCATALVLLLAVRWMGLERVRSATASANLVLGAAVCLVVVSQVTGLRLQEGLGSLLSGTTNPSGRVAHWPPWSWLARALLALATGDALGFARALLPAVGATVVLGAAAVWVGEDLFARGSLSAGTVAARATRVASRCAVAERVLRRLFPAPLVGLILKEFRYVVRDPLLMSQAGMPVILFLVPFVMALNPAFRLQAGLDEMFAFTVLMILLVLYMQASILSASSVGLDGRAFWACLVSPMRPGDVVFAKWLCSWLMSSASAVSMVCLAGIALRAEALTIGVLISAVSGSAAGLCGIGVGISASLPRFAFENPAHRVSPMAMILGFAIGVAYSGAVWGALGAAWFGASKWPEHATAIYLVGGGISALVTLLAVAVPLGLGARRLDTLEWEH